MEISLKIDEEMLESIFVTAIEGGCNYWLDFRDEDIRRIRRLYPKESFSMGLYKAVMKKKTVFPILESESLLRIGELSHSTMQDRLSALANSKEYCWALFNELKGDGDAESADICFQFLTMNEVVYG
jgi:hypothetical protein